MQMWTVTAGLDAAHATLEWGVLLLASCPEVQAKCQEELDRVLGPTKPPLYTERQALPYVTYLKVTFLLAWLFEKSFYVLFLSRLYCTAFTELYYIQLRWVIFVVIVRPSPTKLAGSVWSTRSAYRIAVRMICPCGTISFQKVHLKISAEIGSGEKKVIRLKRWWHCMNKWWLTLFRRLVLAITDATVVFHFYGTHFSEDIWKDPFVFRPERFIDAEGKFQASHNSLPFGTG